MENCVALLSLVLFFFVPPPPSPPSSPSPPTPPATPPSSQMVSCFCSLLIWFLCLFGLFDTLARLLHFVRCSAVPLYHFRKDCLILGLLV